MKKKHKFSVAISMICMLLAIGLLLPSSAGEAEPASFDYGNASIENNQTVKGAELLSMLYGEEATAAEAAYLNSKAEFSFIYTDLLPSSLISTDYNGEAGTLKVSVDPYVFTASNGAVVEWIPQQAVIGDVSLPLTQEGAEYICAFQGLFHSEDYEMHISFAWQVALPGTLCEELLNAAYTKGNEALTLLLAYEAELALYQEQLTAYQKHRDYLLSVERYEAYEKACAEYEGLKMAYDAYLVEYEAYAKELARYQAWRDYWNYVKAEAEYPQKRKEFLEYDAEVQKVKKALAVMESLFASDSNHWQHYASLMGNTVTAVVDRRSELVAAGCDPKHIETAGQTTVVLRELMKGYAEIRSAKYASEHDRYTALYTYYTQHYTELRDGYAALYGALIALYGNSIVIEGLRSEGKLLHFQQFVGQLYLTAVCLDDTQQPLDSWRISKKTLSAVVEPINLVTDGDYADPATNGFFMPATEAENVQPPVPVEQPTFDDPMVKPKAPAVVKEPKIPEVVDPPAQVAPPVAEDPGEAPTAPSMEAGVRALAEEVRKGILKERVIRDAKMLDFTHKVAYSVSISNKMTVTFYDVDGIKIFDQLTVEYGSSVQYSGKTPTREPSEKYYYREFLGWIEANGEPADLSCVTKNRAVYASYKTEDRYYTVTWQIDGQVPVKTQHLYGELPVYPNPLTRPSSDRYTYTFSGWDRQVVPVCEDTTYSGSFVETPKQYTVTWDVDGVQTEEIYSYGDVPYYKQDVPQKEADDYRYVFSGWTGENNAALSVVTKDVTYRANFRKTALADTPEGAVLPIVWSKDAITVVANAPTVVYGEALKLACEKELDLILQWDRVCLVLDAQAQAFLQESACRRIEMKQTVTDTGTVYALRYLTSLGVDTQLPVPAILRVDEGDDAHAKELFYLHGEQAPQLIEELELAVVGAQTVEQRRGYAVRVEFVKDCDLGALPTYAQVGQVIDLNLTCMLGYEVSGAIVTTLDGRTVPVTDRTFVMPQEAVHISLTISKIVYHVTFTVNGAVYHTAEYGLGEEILPPADPTRASDAEYAYTFIGWSPSVFLAAGEDRELTFEAQFAKTALQGSDPYKAEGNSNRLLTIGLPIIGGVTVLSLGILLLLKKKKVLRKKK